MPALLLEPYRLADDERGECVLREARLAFEILGAGRRDAPARGEGEEPAERSCARTQASRNGMLLRRLPVPA